MASSVTRPVLLARSRCSSSSEVSSAPSPGQRTLMTPLSTLTPVAIAVAEAAESVVVPVALLWVIVVWLGNASKGSVPGAPLTYMPPALTCCGPMPSP